MCSSDEDEALQPTGKVPPKSSSHKENSVKINPGQVANLDQSRTVPDSGQRSPTLAVLDQNTPSSESRLPKNGQVRTCENVASLEIKARGITATKGIKRDDKVLKPKEVKSDENHLPKLQTKSVANKGKQSLVIAKGKTVKSRQVQDKAVKIDIEVSTIQAKDTEKSPQHSVKKTDKTWTEKFASKRSPPKKNDARPTQNTKSETRKRKLSPAEAAANKHGLKVRCAKLA